MEYNLEVKNLSKSYTDFKLNNISLQLEKGTIMGLIGENGAGKTTFIKSILNITKTDKGEVFFLGKNLKENEKAIKEEIGVVLDDSFFSEYLNPRDIEKIMSCTYKNWDNQQYDKYLEMFRLSKKKSIKDFSKGMKMKLQIATALSHHPKILILDEPTSGLDPVVRNEILDIFRDFIQDEEKSILLSTHITSDLEHIADYITFMNKGNIILAKTRDELLEGYAMIKCTKKEFHEIDQQDIIKYKKEPYEYKVLVKNKAECRRKYPNITIDRANLEDIMLLYIKGEQV